LGQQLSRSAQGHEGLETYTRQDSLNSTGSAGRTQRQARNQPELGPCNASRNERSQSISAAIEGTIIPRLMLAQGAVSRTPRSPSTIAKVIDANAISGFGDLVLNGAPEAPAVYIEKLLADSFPLERIYLELLAPTARHLGNLWESDTVSFVDVMEGLSKLQGLLRNFGPNSVDLDADGPKFRILLATTPGEQHHFGIVMVDEFFRRAGWGTTCLPASTTDELVIAVRREHFSIVGLSISCEGFLENLAHSIHKVRRASRNRSVRVVVGGNVLIDRPDLVALVGADTAAADGRQAVLQARSLMAMLPLQA